MKTIEQGIAIVIRYKRYRQGLFTDYGSEIDNWFEYYHEEATAKYLELYKLLKK